MGGGGYSDKADFQTFFNETYTDAKFTLMNEYVARKINMFVNLNPSTDVGPDFTNTAKFISDDMLMTLTNFFKESSMENPPEFVHYKLPHFTEQHLGFLNSIKITLGHVGGVST